ncbi:hypothetical protein Tsubulata_036834, partial [Turnera subulata]
IALGKNLYEDGGSERARFEELLNETESILVSNFKEFDIFYQEIIDQHLDPKRPKPTQEDILDVLLQMLKDRSFKVQLTFDHIKAILMNEKQQMLKAWLYSAKGDRYDKC